MYVAKNAIYILQTLLADGVVVGSNFICQLEILLAYWNVFSGKKDLSLLRRLAVYPSYHPTKHAVVQCRRLDLIMIRKSCALMLPRSYWI